MNVRARGSEFHSASERLGAALDRLEGVLTTNPPFSPTANDDMSQTRAETLALTDNAAEAVGEAIVALRAAITHHKALSGESDDGG